MTASNQPTGHDPGTHGGARQAEAIAALMLTMFFWGTSAVFMRSTALSLSAANALALRYVVMVALMAAGLGLTALRGGSWRLPRADWPRLFIAALAGLFGSSWFTMEGFARVAAGLGTVIAMIEPIIISLLAWGLLKERPGKRLWAGLGVSVLGGAVLFWPDITATAANPVDGLGVFYLICASTCFAIYTIAAKPLLARHSSFTVTGWTMLITAVPVLLLASKPLSQLISETPARPWAEIIYLAVFNSIIGTVLWNFGTRHLTGARAGTFLYLMPVFAVAAGYLILDEPITAHLVLGGIFVLAGVALAQSRAKR